MAMAATNVSFFDTARRAASVAVSLFAFCAAIIIIIR